MYLNLRENPFGPTTIELSAFAQCVMSGFSGKSDIRRSLLSVEFSTVIESTLLPQLCNISSMQESLKTH